MNSDVNDLVGISWTNSNSKYRAIAKIVKVNSSSIRIELVKAIPSNYDVGTQWTVSNKFTKGNNIFKLGENAEQEINEYNRKQQETENFVSEKINNYWKGKIEDMENNQKKEGVYKSGELHVIHGNKLEKIKDNMEISV